MSTAINIDHTTYRKIVDGVEVEVVDSTFVERFLNAASFFDGLVDKPEVHEQDADGTITVTQTTPEGNTRITIFEPEA